MRITLMHNPAAGGGEVSRERLLSLLREAGYEAAYQSTKEEDYAEALEDPGRLVVAAGGDGTVGKAARRLAGRGIPLAVLPLGTANNIAHTLGITGTVNEVIAGWAGARRTSFDVGLASGPWGERRFLESVGGGLFTRIMSFVDAVGEEDASFRTREEELRRDLRVLCDALSEAPAEPWKLVLDGEEITGRYVLVEAMNVQFVGPNLHLAPQADPGDGLLDVVLLTEEERDEFAAYVTSRLKGGSPRPDFTARRGRHLRIHCDGPALHVDDEVWPEQDAYASGPDAPSHFEPAVVDVRAEHAALEVLVPE